MIRKTALLAGVAGALMFAAPTLAQETTAAPAAAQTQGSITVQPGATVRGEGGAELGRLQGVRTNAAGEQELEVRGADGQLRAVPLGGLRQDGDVLVVAWTQQQYQAAPTITPTTPAPASPAMPAVPAVPGTTPAAPAEPASPAAPADPAESADPTAPPPTLPTEPTGQPDATATPEPGEGAPPTAAPQG